MDDLEAGRSRLEAVAPGYLDRVRRAAGRLAVREGVTGDVDAALDDVREAARVDTDVPTQSRRRSVHLLKVAVRALTGWYFRYLGQQVQVLGESVSRLGEAMVARTEGVEAGVGTLRRDLDALARRVDDLDGARRDRAQGPLGR